MATAQPDDQFLVNRNGVSYNVTQANLMAQIQDDDLMLVNRDNISYKITGAEVKDSFVDPIEIQSVTLSNTTPTVGDNVTAIVVATGGKNPVTAYQWQRDGVDIPVVQTYTLGVPNVQGNSQDATYTVQQADVGKKLDCVVTITDDLGSTATQTSPETSPVLPNEAVDQPDLLTPPNGTGLNPEPITPTTDSLSSVSTTGTTTTVVASGNEDLDILQEGSALMTDAGGTVATYTPTSNTITNVTTVDVASFIAAISPPGVGTSTLGGSNATAVFSDEVGGYGFRTTSTGASIAIGFNFAQFTGDVPARPFTLGSRTYGGQGTNIDSLDSLVPMTTAEIVYSDDSSEALSVTQGSDYNVSVEIPDNGKDINYVLFNRSGSGYDNNSSVVTEFTFNGTKVTASNGTLLTFSDNQDLTYFKVGDVVQNE